jgi:hypothetical protein
MIYIPNITTTNGFQSKEELERTKERNVGIIYQLRRFHY